MLIAVCDECSEGRQKVRGLIEGYGRKKAQDIRVEEYLSGARLCSDMERVKDDLDARLPECLDDLLDKLRRKNQKAFFAFVEGNLEH